MADVIKLQVETGAVTVELEDERGEKLGQFDFNPTDSNILKRYGAAVDFFNGLSYDEAGGDEEQLAAMNALADDIAGQFDLLLGGPVSEGIFAKCGPLTVTKDGDFFFEKVLEGVGSLIEQTTKKRLDKKLAKVRKAAADVPSVKRGGK